MAVRHLALLLLCFGIAGCTELRDSQGYPASLRTKGALELDSGSAANSAGLAQTQHRAAAHHAARHRITKQPEIEQHLVICNAYASPTALDIFHVQSLERLTNSAALGYKECREFTMNLQEGDQLDFKAGSADVGTFYATGLPQNSASLLLIPHRREPSSDAISFESHAFADLQTPQIAVVDTYGSSESSPSFVKIIDAEPQVAASKDEKEGEEPPVEEELQFSSVVAVNPGKYKVTLSSSGTFSEALPLLAQTQAKYVIMRVGSDSNGTTGENYPQELVVFPQSGALPTASLSAAALAFSCMVVAMALA